MVGVALDHRQTARHALIDAALRQLDAASVDLLVGLQQFEQRAVAAADVEHLGAGVDQICDDLEVDAGRAVHAHVDSPRARAAEVRKPSIAPKSSGSSSRKASWPRSVSISTKETDAPAAF